jgi:hypothetical protein
MTLTPAISIVVVTAGRFRNLRRTVAHLRAQTIAARIELLVVAADPACLADAHLHELLGFAAVQRVFTATPITNVDHASAHGVHAATAPIVALIEDHAYPEPAWSERIVEAHLGPWAVVGGAMINANPDSSPWSWTNLLIAYGPSTDPTVSGEVDALPGHNIAFKTESLRAYGDGLAARLGRAGGLLDSLRDRGGRFYRQASARLAHANPSRLAPTIQLRFCAGRLYGHLRARDNNWTPLHRIVYVAGGLLIPFLRIGRFRQEFFTALPPNSQRASIHRASVLPALWFGLLLDALGQMAGYALGPGRAADVLAVFEMDRMQHLTPADRRLLESPDR